MSSTSHPSFNHPKNAQSRPNKSKSKKKPAFLQPGHEGRGFLVVVDETIETPGPLINELFSFFEQFPPDLEPGIVGQERNNIVHTHIMTNNSYPDVSTPQSLLPDFVSEQKSQGTHDQPSTFANINDSKIKLLDDLKQEVTKTSDSNSSEEIGQQEDELNHNTLTNSTSNDKCVIDSCKHSEPVSTTTINESTKTDAQAGGTSLIIMKEKQQQQQQDDGSSLISPTNPKKITVLTRPKQGNDGEQKLGPRKVPQLPKYNTNSTSGTTKSKSSPSNQSPSLPIPVPRELIEILANNYDAAQDGRSPNAQSKVQLKKKQYYLLQSKTFNMPKPQLNFITAVVNDDSPFVPKLPFKPNAKVPLSIQPIKCPRTGKIYYDNPYHVEISDWTAPLHMMTLSYDWPLRGLRETPYHLVQSYPSLQMMMKDLHQVPEIAFDVEHSDRSYFGLTCIIQISTRFKDYIVDCFTLRDHLHCLNSVCTDPNILKVAHNANGDVINLQRDFGIYVVGLFDTSEAAKVLSASKRSVGLAALLSTYLHVETDKKYQLADWRIRPIPYEMVNYARTDTHYLLKLYDILKSQLLSSGTTQLLCQCYEDSKDVCRLRYEKPTVDNWVSKFDERYTNQQKYALTELNKWRNAVARQEDDGLGHIASHKILSCLAEALPTNAQELLNAIRGAGRGRIPEFMERDMQHVLNIFQTAKAMPLLPKTKNLQPRRVVSEFLKTRISNVLFFKAKPYPVQPTEVVDKIMKYQTRPSFVRQILPVATTCERDLNTISRELQKLLINYQGTPENEVFGVFHNFCMEKQNELVSCIKNTVAQMKPSWKFTETPTDFCIVVFGVDKICCLSIVNGFVKFNGYKMLPSLNRQHLE